ncbi:hypothetical protein PABG_11170 [Paracoccidioides brasiliensis Pb03]|nr:hypothetical protein PABG_11170 [Paracoccidioides brasiliensis Pb03]
MDQGQKFGHKQQKLRSNVDIIMERAKIDAITAPNLYPTLNEPSIPHANVGQNPTSTDARSRHDVMRQLPLQRTFLSHEHKSPGAEHAP